MWIRDGERPCTQAHLFLLKCCNAAACIQQQTKRCVSGHEEKWSRQSDPKGSSSQEDKHAGQDEQDRCFRSIFTISVYADGRVAASTDTTVQMARGSGRACSDPSTTSADRAARALSIPGECEEQAVERIANEKLAPRPPSNPRRLRVKAVPAALRASFGFPKGWEIAVFQVLSCPELDGPSRRLPSPSEFRLRLERKGRTSAALKSQTPCRYPAEWECSRLSRTLRSEHCP